MHWLAELDGRRISVEVPATSANLGAGYDCLGLALELTNRIELEVRGWSRSGIELTVEGEGAGELPADSSNRFVRGLEAALRDARGEMPEGVGWRISMTNRIPLARGLGSSAAATIGGLIAGNALVGDSLATPDLLRLATAVEGHPDNAAAALLGGSLAIADLLRLATEVEGHPDNAAAALLGGFVVVGTVDGVPEAIRFDPPRDLRAVLFIPDLRLETQAMRAALPDLVPRLDAVDNLGRVALGVAGIATGRHDLLRSLTVDHLHEPYRAAVYPQLPRLVEAARGAGALGAALSGAGSSVIAFSDSVATLTRIEAALSAVAAEHDLPGRVAIVSPRNAGARVVAGG